MTADAVVFTIVAVSFAAAGVGLVLRHRSSLAGALMTLAGALGTVSMLLFVADHDTAGAVVGYACVSLAAPLALLAYPRLRYRHPVDFLALVSIGGCGVVTTAYVDVGVAGLLGFIQACVFLVHTWWRIELAAERERRALVWMALAVSVSGLVYFFATFSSEGVAGTALPLAGALAFALIGPALYVGATLPDLVDVRGLVVGSVVTSFALITVMAVFILEISLLDALDAGELNDGALAALAALAATAYQPTRVVLRGVVDQLLFGERPDPLGAASAMVDRISDDPVVALRAIREALVIPYAALVVDDETVAASGTESTHTRTLELDGAGRLVVGLRPGDLALNRGDEQVLRLTVPLLAQTLRARALAAEVVESRGRTIAAVEEERRRLRRDLHDGLGPRLSGVAFTSDAARNLIRTDPAAAEELVSQLRADTVTAIEEIRAMVYAMRPPALDELGLVPALRQQATGLRNGAGEQIEVTITAPGLPPLPAAVEVAAYRIVTEALANVARHSTSPSATVRLDAEGDGLRLEISDLGNSEAWRPGVGLASMRERAAELGGTLTAGPGPDGGAVTAVLPLLA